MDTQLINPTKLHEELALQGLPVISVSSDDRIDYSRKLSSAEQTKAQDIIKAHDPLADPKPTMDQIVMALWKKIMLNDSTDADDLLQIMNPLED